MIFLIEYNRSEGHIVTFRDFDDSQRREAEDSRLEIELDLNRKGVQHEVVLLEAASQDELRRTHRRYFEDLRQILKSRQEFTAVDESGREYRLRVYQESVSASTRANPLAVAPGVKRIVTEHGESVNRLKTGEYQIVATGVILRSSDRDVP